MVKVNNPCTYCKATGDGFTCLRPDKCRLLDETKEFIESTDKVAAILDERGGLQGTGRYGPFIDNAVIAQETKHVWHKSPNWEKLNAAQQEALDLIAMKVSRILSGDPNYVDNWDDIEGYSRLAKHNWQKDAS